MDRLLDPLLGELLRYIPPPAQVAAKGRAGGAPATKPRMAVVQTDHNRIHYLLNRITALVRYKLSSRF